MARGAALPSPGAAGGAGVGTGAVLPAGVSAALFSSPLLQAQRRRAAASARVLVIPVMGTHGSNCPGTGPAGCTSEVAVAVTDPALPPASRRTPVWYRGHDGCYHMRPVGEVRALRAVAAFAL